jgi:tetratricopeptide (TPR) repeat protein
LQAEPGNADANHLLGVIAQQVGKHEMAVAYIERAIALNGNVAAFHNNLGNALRDLGKLDEAVTAYRRALKLKPDFAEARHNLGNALRDQGKLDEAAACGRRAVQLKPNFAEAHYNLGVTLRDQGNLGEAVACYRRALELKPDFAEAHSNLGDALKGQGKLDEAVCCYRRTVELKPNRADAHYNLGTAFLDQRKLDEAVACYRRAVELKPDYAEAHNNLGTALKDLGNPDEAVACYRSALRRKPDFAEAHNNLGNALRDQQKLDEAVACYRSALRRKPDFAEAHYNLGCVFKDQGKLDEAVACSRSALELTPDFTEAYGNLGNSLIDQGKLDEAVACWRRALELKPDYADAHLGLAMAQLLRGDFQQGWLEYEWRWRTKQASPRPFRQPLWDGSSLAGHTILLHAEQGLGDTLQFVRYAPLVKRLGGTVLLECQRPLVALLVTCPGVDRLVGQGDPLPDFTTHAPLLSLPRILGTPLDAIPAKVPYLFASPALVDSWRETLRDVRGYKIGINWQGRAGQGSWLARNVPLQQFAKLAEIPGVRLISLQKGAARDELAQAGETFPLVDLGDQLDQAAGAFMDTAAIMMNLDLVITSDTAVPHLAGALGVPVWLALPFAPDWRWLLERSDSPWYPTMRLFRPRERGNWQSVFDGIRTELCARLPSATTDAAK